MTETVIPTAKAWPTDNLLQEMIGKTVANIGFPGAIALLSTPGRETWIASFGTSDRATNAPMTADMHTRVGSITKMFTATLVLQLMDAGSLSLDDTLAVRLPSAADLPHAESITLRHLLNMRSGIYNYTEDGEAFAKLFASTDSVWTHEELIDIARAHDAYFEPGAEFHYSNTNYILLEMIIERVTERPFGELLQERLLTPLGLSGTVLPSSPSMPEPFSTWFRRQPGHPACTAQRSRRRRRGDRTGHAARDHRHDRDPNLRRCRCGSTRLHRERSRSLAARAQGWLFDQRGTAARTHAAGADWRESLRLRSRRHDSRPPDRSRRRHPRLHQFCWV